MFKVWLDDPLDHKHLIKNLLPDNLFTGVKSIHDADVVFFRGVLDLPPSYYNQQPIPGITGNSEQIKLFDWIWERSQHCVRVGIGSAGQYLNIKSGGDMLQKIDNHHSDHLIEIEGQPHRKVWVTSRHNSQMLPGVGAEVIAYVSEGKFISQHKSTDEFTWNRTNSTSVSPYWRDYEVVWYNKTKSLCWQPDFMANTTPTQYRFFSEVMEAIMEKQTCAA